MKKAYIYSQKCKHDHLCPPKKMCPVAAIGQDKKFFLLTSPSFVKMDKCIGCGKCIYHCPNHAITMI